MDLRSRVPSITHLSRALGISRQHVWSILRGYDRPSAELAKRMDEVTNGKLKRWELRPDLWDPPEAA